MSRNRAPWQTDEYVEAHYEPDPKPPETRQIDRGPWVCTTCQGPWPDGATCCPACGQGTKWGYPKEASDG